MLYIHIYIPFKGATCNNLSFKQCKTKINNMMKEKKKKKKLLLTFCYGPASCYLKPPPGGPERM